jgi:hypothetical protein
VDGAPNKDFEQVTGPARAAGSDGRIAESTLPDNDISQPNPVLDENRESRVVIDFTVGPAGVGPPTSITPTHADKPRHHHPKRNQAEP